MKTQFIVTVPEATEASKLPSAVQKLFQLLEIAPQVTWTMPGTRAYNGRRAIMLQGTPDDEVLGFLLDMFNATSGAGWELVAAQPFKLTKAYDTSDPENPVFTGYEGAYKKVPLSFVDYLVDLVDEGGNTSRPVAPCALSAGSGADPWQWEAAE